MFLFRHRLSRLAESMHFAVFFFASELKYRTDRRNILLPRYDILHSCCPMTGDAIDELAKTGFRRWILSPF